MPCRLLKLCFSSRVWFYMGKNKKSIFFYEINKNMAVHGLKQEYGFKWHKNKNKVIHGVKQEYSFTWVKNNIAIHGEKLKYGCTWG